MWLRNLFLHRKSVQKLCRRTFINPKVTKERLLSEYQRATAYVNGKIRKNLFVAKRNKINGFQKYFRQKATR